MIQFSESDVRRFREDPRKDEMVAYLRGQVQEFLDHPILVPKSGIVNWGQYFYCPDCSVMLIHNLDSQHDHECPVCHKHFQDELKDGAWWRHTDAWNENAIMNIGRIHVLTGETGITRKAIDVILEYAKYYEGCVEHGDIPYNGPGKLNAQTLDESNFLRRIAYGYDMLSDAMTEEERTFIKEHLFKPGMEFLKAHRRSHLHNHEVVCNGAVGVLALILEDRETMEWAINGKYGLIYQLEHATLEDDYWFECSTAYHFYALQNFFHYEKFARHTEYSNLDHPKYHGMILSILRLQKDDLFFPLLNDSHANQGNPNGYDLFEFSYALWHDDRILEILNKLYETSKRIGVESFFYGEPVLPKYTGSHREESLPGENGLGCSVLRRGKDYLLFRHGPYGGEHDHYDRLGISYYHDDVPVSIDMGTTGYGAPLHYAYYKRTNTHNTVVLNNGNQAPSCGKLLAFEEDDEHILVKASVDWNGEYEMPDIFTILQWDEESYKDVHMERTIVLTDYGYLDRFEVSGAKDGTVIDLNTHFSGDIIRKPEVMEAGKLGEEGPYSFFHDVEKVVEGGVFHSVYENEGVVTDCFVAPGLHDSYLSRSFGNPSNNDISYITERLEGNSAVFTSFVSSGREDRVVDVDFQDGKAIITTVSGIRKEIIY